MNEDLYQVLAQVEQLRGELEALRAQVEMEQAVGNEQPMIDISVKAVEVAGRRWNRTDWTGSKSDYLKIPFDGSTAPSYIAVGSFPAKTTLPEDGDARNDAAFILLSESAGPVVYIWRA